MTSVELIQRYCVRKNEKLFHSLSFRLINSIQLMWNIIRCEFSKTNYK